MQPARRLAAILFTDIVGSTAIMRQDEQAALVMNKRYVAVLKQSVSSHDGEILNDYGDGSLCTFSSATEAVRCAIAIQQQLQTEPKVPLRIGLHVGEIFFEDGKVFGDGVNVASRVQSLGVANSILFSSEICSKIKNQPEFKSISIGKFEFKNVDEKMEVFALTNDGLMVPDRRKMDGKLREKKISLKRFLLPSAIIILGIISIFIYRIYYKYPGFTGKDKSIAVLPFETISSDSGNEYISDGFTIDIISKLSNLSDLSLVPGWAIVKTFKDPKQNIIDIAHRLGVEAILTGTIQRQGDNLHIVTELTDVNSGKTIWSMDDYRKWGDVLKLQMDVAEKIAASLSARLTKDDKNVIAKEFTKNADAYNYYIKGRYFWDKRTPESFDSAEASFNKAIELDPNYALAYAGLADCYTFNLQGMSQTEAVPIARDYINKALSIDSTLAEPLATLGLIQSAYDYDWKNAKLTLEKALRLDPKYTYAHIFYGNLLQYTGESTERGLEEIKKARSLDPLSVSINWILGRNYYLAGKMDSAEEQLRKTIGINSQYPMAKAYLAYVLIFKKEFTEAIEIIKQLPVSGKVTNALYKDPILSYAYAIEGNRPAAQEELGNWLTIKSFKGHYQTSIIYTGLKMYDLAISELNKAYQDREIDMYLIKVDPALSPLWDKPAFHDLLKKMNLE